MHSRASLTGKGGRASTHHTVFQDPDTPKIGIWEKGHFKSRAVVMPRRFSEGRPPTPQIPECTTVWMQSMSPMRHKEWVELGVVLGRLG